MLKGTTHSKLKKTTAPIDSRKANSRSAQCREWSPILRRRKPCRTGHRASKRIPQGDPVPGDCQKKQRHKQQVLNSTRSPWGSTPHEKNGWPNLADDTSGGQWWFYRSPSSSYAFMEGHQPASSSCLTGGLNTRVCLPFRKPGIAPRSRDE